MLGERFLTITPVFFAVVDRLTRGTLANHPWVRAVSEAGLYALRLKYLKPLAGAVRRAAAAGIRKATKGRFGA
jgi:hypothetical protein